MRAASEDSRGPPRWDWAPTAGAQTPARPPLWEPPLLLQGHQATAGRSLDGRGPGAASTPWTRSSPWQPAGFPIAGQTTRCAHDLLLCDPANLSPRERVQPLRIDTRCFTSEELHAILSGNPRNPSVRKPFGSSPGVRKRSVRSEVRMSETPGVSWGRAPLRAGSRGTRTPAGTGHSHSPPRGAEGGALAGSLLARVPTRERTPPMAVIVLK